MLQEHRLEGQEFLKSNFLYCTVILFAPNLTHARTPCKDTMRRRTDRQTDGRRQTHTDTHRRHLVLDQLNYRQSGSEACDGNLGWVGYGQ